MTVSILRECCRETAGLDESHLRLLTPLSRGRCRAENKREGHGERGENKVRGARHYAYSPQ
jgi:hypothetical protein